MKPPLRQPPPTPPPAWWTLPLTREQFADRAKQEAARMNAVQTTQHVQCKQGDK